MSSERFEGLPLPHSPSKPNTCGARASPVTEKVKGKGDSEINSFATVVER
jgi:hypothetical protein